MRGIIWGACLAVAGSWGVMAQTPDEQLTFEVASVKPAAPMTGMRISMGARGGPGSSDPGHINYNNLTLKNLVVMAFGVKGYQVSGPSWMDQERFDITAKVPQGTTKEQVKFMLQNLLKERFQMSFHREKKDLPMYSMTVGKSGPKMKETPPEEAAPTPADGPKTPGPNDDPPKLPQLGKVTMGPDGMPQMPAGFGPKEGCMMMMMMSPAGPRSHMQCRKQTMAKLAEQLSNQLDRPVTDMTGLTAGYDFTLDFQPDESRMPMMIGPGGGATMSRDGGPGPGGPGGPGPDVHEIPTAPPLPAAIQEQLGLKLEQKKGPVDLVVIDKIEKTPTEN